MLPLGTLLPAFALPDFDGRTVSTAQYEHARALLVTFICQHCPFVRHIRSEFARFAREYQPRGLVLLAVNSNDIGAFPEDGPEGMRQEAQAFDYVFPYLFDETPRDGWSIADSSTTAGRARPRRSPAVTFALRLMRCSNRATSRPCSGRASVATSSGSRGTNRTTSDVAESEKPPQRKRAGPLPVPAL
jgi:thiol-disulfide isomerase/thioredoxin